MTVLDIIPDPIIPPGSRDPGISNSPITNPGIEKTGPGLESLLLSNRALRALGGAYYIIPVPFLYVRITLNTDVQSGDLSAVMRTRYPL